jgi:hypothetical protein
VVEGESRWYRGQEVIYNDNEIIFILFVAPQLIIYYSHIVGPFSTSIHGSHFSLFTDYWCPLIGPIEDVIFILAAARFVSLITLLVLISQP